MNDPCPYGWKVISSDKITSAIANGYSNSGLYSVVFNQLSALAVDAGGSFIYTAGENRHWTSGASTNGSRVLTDAINVDSTVLSVAQNTGTCVGYQIRCQKE